MYVYVYTYIERYVSIDLHFGVFWDSRVPYLRVTVLFLYISLYACMYTGWYIMADSFSNDYLLYVHVFCLPGIVMGMVYG